MALFDLTDEEREEVRAEIAELEGRKEPPLRPVDPDWYTGWQERCAGLQRHIDRLQAMLNGGARCARHPGEPKCERCSKTPIVGMWSSDGLPGHEILVCYSCWDYLNAEVPDE